MKLKILAGLVLSVALLAMSGCGGGGGGGGTAGTSGSTVTASAGPGGTISPPGTTTVLPTFSVAYTITPDPGYTVSDVLIDGFSFGAITGFEFGTGGHTIHATFVKRPKTALVKLVTLGPLPTGTLIGGVNALLLYSQTLGLTINQVPPYNVVKSGNANIAGATVFGNVSSSTGRVRVVMSSATGIGAGEFATATFKLFSSVLGPVVNGNVPSAANFAISQADSTVTDTAAAAILGMFPFVGPVVIK